MKSKNLFVACSGNNLLRLEEEYRYLGRYTVRVPGGISVAAITPGMEKSRDGSWRWVFPKPKKKTPPRAGKRRDDEEGRSKPSREQRPKERTH